MMNGPTIATENRFPGQRGLFHLARKLPLFWRLHMGGWLLFGLSTIPIRMFMVSNVYVDMSFRTALAYYLLRDIAAMFFCVGLRYLYRLPVFYRLRPASLSAILVLICFFWASGEMILCQPVVSSILSGVSVNDNEGLLAATVWFRTCWYLLWSFCYFAIKNFLEARL